MKIVIVEDEPAAVRQLKRLIQRIEPTAEIIAHFDSIEIGVEWFKKNPSPDLAFFDIQLSDGLSFEIFEQVTLICPIIFTTAFDHYALQAFKVNSIDYLLKPIKEEELAAALKKFNSTKNSLPNLIELAQMMRQQSQPNPSYKSRFLIKKAQQYLSIDVKEIAYIYSEDKITFLQTTQKRHSINYSLDELEQSLSPALFFRLNRKVIAAYPAIKKIHTYFNGKLLVELYPVTKDKIIVSRDKATPFKAWLDQ